MEGLRKQADPLVIVTNNVFEDGMIYDDSTMEYIEALGRINERLAAEADEVVEVVAGFPPRTGHRTISTDTTKHRSPHPPMEKSRGRTACPRPSTETVAWGSWNTWKTL